MKASLLRSIELAFSPRDEEKLERLARMTEKTPAQFLVETIRKIHAETIRQVEARSVEMAAEVLHE